MLLNLSNHPSAAWPDNQKEAARQSFGEVQDLAFPSINPEWDLLQVRALAEEYLKKIKKLNPAAVHLMGEFAFTYSLVNLLREEGIPCIMSTTYREVVEKEGKKIVVFRFVRFRRYFTVE